MLLYSYQFLYGGISCGQMQNLHQTGMKHPTPVYTLELSFTDAHLTGVLSNSELGLEVDIPLTGRYQTNPVEWSS